MVKQFFEHLPPYLRRVAVMYQEGYNYKEIAEALGVALGTVQRYIARIAQLGRIFFEIDDNKTVARLVNMGGSSAADSTSSVKEVNHGSLETTAVVDDERYSALDCQHRSDAPHLSGAERTARGGANMYPTMNSNSCGCSQPKMEVSPEKVKAVLKAHSGRLRQAKEAVYEPQQRRKPGTRVEVGVGVEVPVPPGSQQVRCEFLEEVCVDVHSIVETEQEFCDRRNWYGSRCEELYPEFNGDHYKKQRKRYKFVCRGPRRTVVWVHCTRWNVINCCDRPTSPPDCLGGASRLCNRNGRDSSE
jgi:predicted transcriptional regulator